MRERAEAEPEAEPVAAPKCPPATAPLFECATCSVMRRGIPLEAVLSVLHAAIYED